MMCFMPDYMGAVCPTFPIKLIKTVRLRMRNTEALLAQEDLNLKVRTVAVLDYLPVKETHTASYPPGFKRKTNAPQSR
jgi:hypothetical protein